MNEETQDPALGGEVADTAVSDLKSGPSTVRESLESARDQLAQKTDTNQPIVDAAQAAPGTQQAPVIDANVPKHWKAEDKAMFSKQTPEAQKWLLSRHKEMEADNTRNSQQVAEYKRRYEPMEQIFAPHRERLASVGQTEADVTRNLLAAQVFLEKDPVQGIRWLMQNLGVDSKQLSAADNGQQAEDDDDPFATLDPRVAAHIKALNEKVGTIEGSFEQGRRAQSEQAQRSLQQSIQDFTSATDAAGAPQYPHIQNESVRTTMSALIKSGIVDIEKCGGIAPALKAAYDKAVYSVDETRDALLQNAREAEAKKAADERTRQVNKAKKAGVSVSGASTSSASSASQGSVRSTVRDAARQQGWTV